MSMGKVPVRLVEPHAFQAVWDSYGSPICGVKFVDGS